MWVTRKRGNSSLYAGTRIRDDRSETVGSGTEKYPAWTSNKAVMVNSLSVHNWNETAVPSGARPN